MEIRGSELHVMIDLETLSLGSRAIVTEVGVCLFDPYAEGALGGSHSWLLKVQPQLATRDFTWSTAQWWLMQGEEARKKMATAEENRLPFDEFFAHFGHLNWEDIKGTWSNGLNFDIPILDTLFTDFNQKTPWHYRTPRDTRTLYWLAGMADKATHVKPALAHSAEHDAIAQALTVQKAFRKIHDWRERYDDFSHD